MSNKNIVIPENVVVPENVVLPDLVNIVPLQKLITPLQKLITPLEKLITPLEKLISPEVILTPELKEISYPITIKSTIRTEIFSYSDMLKKGLLSKPPIEEPKIEPKEEIKEKPQTLLNKNRRFTRN